MSAPIADRPDATTTAKRERRSPDNLGPARLHPEWCDQRCHVSVGRSEHGEVFEVVHMHDVATAGGHTVFVARSDEVTPDGDLITTHEAIGVDQAGNDMVLTTEEALALSDGLREAARLLPAVDLDTVRHVQTVGAA